MNEKNIPYNKVCLFEPACCKDIEWKHISASAQCLPAGRQVPWLVHIALHGDMGGNVSEGDSGQEKYFCWWHVLLVGQ